MLVIDVDAYKTLPDIDHNMALLAARSTWPTRGQQGRSGLSRVPPFSTTAVAGGGAAPCPPPPLLRRRRRRALWPPAPSSIRIDPEEASASPAAAAGGGGRPAAAAAAAAELQFSFGRWAGCTRARYPSATSSDHREARGRPRRARSMSAPPPPMVDRRSRSSSSSAAAAATDDDDDDAPPRRARRPSRRGPAAAARNKDLPDCKVKRNYTCASCDFFTQNPREHLYHLRDVHREKVRVYECPSCLYASKHFQKLLRHAKMVHGAGEAGKPRKRRSSSSSSDRSAPRDEEEDDDGRQALYKCSVCVFSSRSRHQMTRHEREEHIKTKFFRCSKCTYVTHIKARYTKHVKYHSMPMIKCDMCDFRTPYKWNLDRHCKNHNGKGAFRCSACNFTADIKQSLTVHEMNHHVPPVGQAAGIGVGRRRNKVGASDATAAEERRQQQEQPDRDDSVTATPAKKPKLPAARASADDFVDPDDLVHHSNGKVYIKAKCKLCNFKTAWDGEMAKHERKVHRPLEDDLLKLPKKTPRPIPNLIPIPSQTAVFKVQTPRAASFPALKVAEIPETSEPAMSQKEVNDICAKSANSALKDLASLFDSEDVFKNESKVPDLIPTAEFVGQQKGPKSGDFKKKNASFFDKLKEKLEQGTGCNLVCGICGHESKCLTEQVKHQKICGKETSKVQNLMPVHNISSSRCQYCRQRCKSSADLYNHLQTCVEALKPVHNREVKEEVDTSSEPELKIDEDRQPDGGETKPHPMENRVFVWNDIMVPMDIEVDDSNYEYTEDKLDDNGSLDLSIRTQSPACSESSYQETNNNYSALHHASTTPTGVSEKIPTHGNDISVAQHKRVFKCPHCTFWASTASRFHVHIVGHLNKKPFECSLCAYRSNWRWDITKHIKLKSVRDQAHESAKVLMTDETGRRNYTKYNKYLTEIPMSSLQSSETSGGSGTRPRNHGTASTSRGEPRGGKGAARPPPPLRAADSQLLAKISQERKRSADGKRTLFKCKKCNFRDASRETLLEHVKRHYEDPQQLLLQQQQQRAQQPSAPAFPSTSALALDFAAAAAAAAATASSQDLSLIRGTSPDRDDEASVNNGSAATRAGGAAAPFRCGHCNQVSNWKHVIQRHCRLKHSGDVRVVSNKNGQERIEIEEQTDEPDHVDLPQEGAYKCTLCPFSHNSSTEFDRHRLGHESSAEGTFKCSLCRFCVVQKQDLLDHLKLHGVTDPEDFHAKTVSPEFDSKKFRCVMCPYVTNSKSQYTYHKQFHRPRGGQYTCSHCSYNVSKRHLLHQHFKVHGINVNSQKQNGEVVDLEEVVEEVEDLRQHNDVAVDSPQFTDTPLVWVCKNNKISKMFKCRFCPHVNLRKINIQEHEKMHSVREKAPCARIAEIEHRCRECNYVCNNAGVLSSHSKVHQGLYGTILKLVDASKCDDEEVKELSKKAGITLHSNDASAEVENEIDEVENAETVTLYFCKECPARFLKENEYSIHKKLHSSWLEFTCDYCSYTSKQQTYLLSHLHVHTTEYQERTKVLKTMYATSANHPQPAIYSKGNGNGDSVWIVKEESNEAAQSSSNATLTNILNKPPKPVNVPLSGTELFQQKAEAQQKQAAEMQVVEQTPQSPPKPADPQFGTLMHGNPEFIYQTYLKNGRMKEKRYKCHKCPSAFEKREQYKVHLGLHGSQQKYKCEYCDYSVPYNANYVQHLKKHKYSDDANAARRSNDGVDELEEVDEATEVTNEVSPEECEASATLKISTADQQMLNILAERQESPDRKEDKADDRKLFWCSHCPYTSVRRDAVENHQKRHAIVSGVTNAFTCDHCDYSVPQVHFLREHAKLHFVPNKVNQPDGYMVCDNLKLNASDLKTEASSDIEPIGDVIFEEQGADDKEFLPPLCADVAEKFNNNRGEKQFVDVQTGDLAVKSDDSDIKSCNVDEDGSKMEVN